MPPICAGAAERRLKRQRPEGRRQWTELETARLVHELQVHQIELKMQNEELLQARTGLEKALEECTEIFHSAPMGYLTLARDGTIRHANLTAARMMGVERSRLLEPPHWSLRRDRCPLGIRCPAEPRLREQNPHARRSAVRRQRPAAAHGAAPGLRLRGRSGMPRRR